MDNSVFEVLAMSLVIAAAMTGGVFQSFSDFVMAGLGQAGSGGAKGMQGLNRTVMRSVFLYTIFALAPAAMALAWFAGPSVSATAVLAVWTGAGVYAIGVILVTMAGNVPMNNKLEGLDAESAAGLAYWQVYLVDWTRWNTVRTLACYAASLCFAYAVIA